MAVRIIAKLDVKPPFVVKPVHFEGLRKVGKPSELAKKYYDQGADELVYIDIVSSLYQREILFNEIEQVANKLFRSPHLWHKVNGVWELKKPIWR
mgnify:CR=1 FL=1